MLFRASASGSGAISDIVLFSSISMALIRMYPQPYLVHVKGSVQ